MKKKSIPLSFLVINVYNQGKTLSSPCICVSNLSCLLHKQFSKPAPDITNLKARIKDAFATITEDMLENTWRETDYRLDVLRVTKGAHVEVY